MTVLAVQSHQPGLCGQTVIQDDAHCVRNGSVVSRCSGTLMH